MGLFVEQNSNRTKLQERLATELSEKAKKKAAAGNDPLPDGVNDSRYMENTKKTTSLAWVWILITIVAVVAAVWFMVQFALKQ
jgi:ectoine hydroxylase-related dioxygenase (phytanoyl-CoA dioxygenase family)